MTVHTESMMTWLRRQRRNVELVTDVMACHFDLDGALDAGQLGLVWIARQDLLAAGVELHLRGRGTEPESVGDRCERISILLRLLARSDGRLADQAWNLLEEPAETGVEQARVAVGRTIAFMTRELGIAAAESRAAAMLAWADAIVLLRSVAQSLGVAQAEDWYLSEGAADDHLDWYDEVLALLSARSADIA